MYYFYEPVWNITWLTNDNDVTANGTIYALLLISIFCEKVLIIFPILFNTDDIVMPQMIFLIRISP
jgi:hypothetical protein